MSMRTPLDFPKRRTRFVHGFIDDARLASAVECRGLTEEHLGQRRFCHE
jgi:hypothetical protein